MQGTSKEKKTNNLQKARRAAKAVKLVIFDVDGVLTDGGIIMDGDGSEYKKFNVRDGHGIKLLMLSGIQVGIITGRYSKVVERRAHELGIKEVRQRCLDKATPYAQMKKDLGVDDSQVAYVGDDIIDIPVLLRAGLPVAVADADAEAKKYALLVTKAKGGYGAAREAAEFILKAKGLWDDLIGAYSKV